ncbi:MAG: HPr(Ser) kinase/phosphatase [Omnitrophica bacterium RIFCSPLOWO2_12_FULL_44_17]|uniref:HPr kinase/phosphorylase n=1 Tax=Candidatus Danuiimicrobium aquiferis TaxID=1801832 RepID=A0A1G1L211_9BACT|nr:MAG: HPr(Ser) kinase/phosphatase [Omnitrophica bacterium RIFCSPHIGHO2_02_FULL_45_28]OGW91284.1 MAG: HPr(Ser) kinase/phosphatase [Omnitrophica bacterium RIFCSPHIGHO2_12_FULL_44_12]OGW99185.1 MAG: HPr(Ser) kinase/phosphatase [Omnitrophica bacterium RIFCSPLOWO2_12_FULL_44_17]OGX04399.1 MAG: HPr(Ser) kinase/phosphatase [Omnitrophica bacterium RIFCSPLOWO2_02_FULL_44_11]
MAYLSVQELFDGLKEELKLTVITPSVTLARKIHSAEINRPGLALSGYYGYFAFDCVQILGKTEIGYLKKLKGIERVKNLKNFFSYRIPCMIVTKQQTIPDDFVEQAIAAKIPILRSPYRTSRVASQVTVFIEAAGSPELSMHATLLDVYGIGTLIMGKSGVGKSECALELIERKHRLVADDIVEIRRENRILMGASNHMLMYHMEIRGLGIIDIKAIFGVGAVRHRKRIDLAVTLEHWEREREYERLGLEEKTYDVLRIKIPHLIIPVRPGRNIPILVETAALNQRLKVMGVHPAQEFNQKLIETMKLKTEKLGLQK